MKTKNFILILLSVILISCNREYELTARLIHVYDHKPYTRDFETDSVDITGAVGDYNSQKMNKKVYRELVLCYKLINQYGDSVFIPYNYDYNPRISVYIQGKKSINAPVFQRGISSKKRGEYLFAPNDTIYLWFVTRLSADLSYDNKWLYEDDVYSLLSKMNVDVTFDSTCSQSKDRPIPNIIFVNDSNGVLINPKPVIKKW